MRTAGPAPSQSRLNASPCWLRRELRGEKVFAAVRICYHTCVLTAALLGQDRQRGRHPMSSSAKERCAAVLLLTLCGVQAWTSPAAALRHAERGASGSCRVLHVLAHRSCGRRRQQRSYFRPQPCRIRVGLVLHASSSEIDDDSQPRRRPRRMNPIPRPETELRRDAEVRARFRSAFRLWGARCARAHGSGIHAASMTRMVRRRSQRTGAGSHCGFARMSRVLPAVRVALMCSRQT